MVRRVGDAASQRAVDVVFRIGEDAVSQIVRVVASRTEEAAVFQIPPVVVSQIGELVALVRGHDRGIGDGNWGVLYRAYYLFFGGVSWRSLDLRFPLILAFTYRCVDVSIIFLTVHYTLFLKYSYNEYIHLCT